jgi:hypothetical protein
MRGSHFSGAFLADRFPGPIRRSHSSLTVTLNLYKRRRESVLRPAKLTGFKRLTIESNYPDTNGQAWSEDLPLQTSLVLATRGSFQVALSS